MRRRSGTSQKASIQRSKSKHPRSEVMGFDVDGLLVIECDVEPDLLKIVVSKNSLPNSGQWWGSQRDLCRASRVRPRRLISETSRSPAEPLSTPA